MVLIQGNIRKCLSSTGFLCSQQTIASKPHTWDSLFSVTLISKSLYSQVGFHGNNKCSLIFIDCFIKYLEEKNCSRSILLTWIKYKQSLKQPLLPHHSQVDSHLYSRVEQLKISIFTEMTSISNLLKLKRILLTFISLSLQRVISIERNSNNRIITSSLNLVRQLTLQTLPSLEQVTLKA